MQSTQINIKSSKTEGKVEPLPQMGLEGSLLGLRTPRPSTPTASRGLETLGKIVDEVQTRGEEARVRASKRRGENGREGTVFIGEKIAQEQGGQTSAFVQAFAQLYHKN